jgi:tetraacyldisaccharide 4'-kinase
MMRRADRFLYRKERSLEERMLLFPLYLLSLPYGWAVRARSLFYSLELLKAKTLPCPVISVGNITVGGTGKTPLVMTLARVLTGRGIPVAVLSRGYKRTQTSEAVVSDGKRLLLSPEASGDEPFLIAQACQGVPVLVGKDRFANGRVALERFGTKGLLLDDGYQHLSLHRDLEILLIDSRMGFGDQTLLPRGILREPLSHLRRAHLFLLTKVNDLEAPRALEKQIREIHPRAQVFHSRYQPMRLVGPRGEEEELDSLKGKKVLALSGIANPDSFSSLLRKCEMEVVREITFPDHHFYRPRDLTSIKERSRGADWIVTTEKDMLKLRGLDMDDLPVRSLRIEMKIWEEEAFFNRVISLF